MEYFAGFSFRIRRIVELVLAVAMVVQLLEYELQMPER